MEDGVPKLEEYTRGWRQSTWKQPYIMCLTFSASMGGLIFGYDSGLISGAPLFVQDDFAFSNTMALVIMAIVGAIFGATIGGRMNDKYGRRSSILIADLLCVAGAIIMALAPVLGVLITGRILMGSGVGMLSMASPLYISETSPPRIRGALVGTNGLLFAVGQFLFYLTNLSLTKAPGTWRWLVGVVGILALYQFILMLFLPESPRWLYRKNKKEEAVDILWKIYDPHEVETEKEALLSSVKNEVADENSSIDEYEDCFPTISKKTLSIALRAGGLSQIAQHLSGIKVVMYFSTTIVQLAGFGSNKMDMALPLITSVLVAVGSIVTITFVDRIGRKIMLFLSMCGTVFGLLALTLVFMNPSNDVTGIVEESSTHFDVNSTCLSRRMTAPDAAFRSCMECCGFCANMVDGDHLDACLISTPIDRSLCIPDRRIPRQGEQEQEHHLRYTNRCPSRYGYLALVWLAVYILSYSMGTATVPWIMNSEIYPLRYRGVCGAMAAVMYWIFSLFFSLSFSPFSEAQEVSPCINFLNYGAFYFMAVIVVLVDIPETKGLPLEEVEMMIEVYLKTKSESHTSERYQEEEEEHAMNHSPQSA